MTTSQVETPICQNLSTIINNCIQLWKLFDSPSKVLNFQQWIRKSSTHACFWSHQNMIHWLQKKKKSFMKNVQFPNGHCMYNTSHLQQKHCMRKKLSFLKTKQKSSTNNAFGLFWCTVGIRRSVVWITGKSEYLTVIQFSNGPFKYQTKELH